MAPLYYNIEGIGAVVLWAMHWQAPKIMPGKGTDFYNEQKEDKD